MDISTIPVLTSMGDLTYMPFQKKKNAHQDAGRGRDVPTSSEGGQDLMSNPHLVPSPSLHPRGNREKGYVRLVPFLLLLSPRGTKEDEAEPEGPVPRGTPGDPEVPRKTEISGSPLQTLASKGKPEGSPSKQESAGQRALRKHERSREGGRASRMH